MAANPQIEMILADLTDLAMNARMVGGAAGQALAADLEALVAKHNGQAGDAPLSPELEQSLRTGLEQSAAGDVADLGDFTQYTEGDDADLGAALGAALEDIANQQRAARERGEVTPVERVLDAIGRGDIERAERMIEAGPFGLGDIEDDEDDEDEYDYDGLDDQINAIGAEQMRAAKPQSMTLLVQAPSGVPVAEDVALKAAADVLPSLVAVVGALEIQGVDYGEEDAQARVTLTVGEDNDGSGLVALGAGREGFNATIADAHGDPLILVGTPDMPADAELAEQLGTLPADLPEVPEGQHPINGALTLVEEITGERPVAETVFTVRYSKDSGAELTEDEVAQILAHPISADLRRLGTVQHIETVPAQELVDGQWVTHPSIKDARFALLEAGQIDLATIAMRFTAYRGTFDFGGTLGVVTANGKAQLVHAEVGADV